MCFRVPDPHLYPHLLLWKSAILQEYWLSTRSFHLETTASTTPPEAAFVSVSSWGRYNCLFFWLGGRRTRLDGSLCRTIIVLCIIAFVCKCIVLQSNSILLESLHLQYTVIIVLQWKYVIVFVLLHVCNSLLPIHNCNCKQILTCKLLQENWISLTKDLQDLHMYV